MYIDPKKAYLAIGLEIVKTKSKLLAVVSSLMWIWCPRNTIIGMLNTGTRDIEKLIIKRNVFQCYGTADLIPNWGSSQIEVYQVKTVITIFCSYMCIFIIIKNIFIDVHIFNVIPNYISNSSREMKITECRIKYTLI